jgi:MoxR-like ATPase
MFNIFLDYPSYQQEVEIVKNTTSGQKVELTPIMNGEEILFFQRLIRKIHIADNVLEYAVGLSNKSRPGTEMATSIVNNYISWGAGPRASQFLVLGAKCHAAINGKYSPDKEDVQAVAPYVLRHRVVRNYKAEAEGVSIDNIIKSLF